MTGRTGCSTCKRRKKRVCRPPNPVLHCILTANQCDLQRPTCANCAKGNHICGGYAREMVMVHVDSFGKGAYKPKQVADKSAVAPIKQVNAFCSPTDLRVQSLNRTSLEFLSFDAFWDTYLPSGRMAADRECFLFTSGAISRWAGYTSHYLPQSEIVRCTLLALGTPLLHTKCM
jgi:hypothetical protein